MTQEIYHTTAIQSFTYETKKPYHKVYKTQDRAVKAIEDICEKRGLHYVHFIMGVTKDGGFHPVIQTNGRSELVALVHDGFCICN